MKKEKRKMWMEVFFYLVLFLILYRPPYSLSPRHLLTFEASKACRMLWNLPEWEACFGFINSGHQQGSCDERLPITAKTITCLKNHALHCLNELLCHHTIQCDLWSHFFYYGKSQNGKSFDIWSVNTFFEIRNGKRYVTYELATS